MALFAIIGKERIKLRTYKFPSRGNQPEDYHLVVDGEKLDSTRVRTTGGGGKEYTYIKTDAQVSGSDSYWLPGALAAGTEVKLEEVADPAPKPPKAATEGTQAGTAASAPKAPTPPAPKAPAPQRPAAKGKK